MQDTKLFETILGIQAPWRISRVALDTTGERVDLWAEHGGERSTARSIVDTCSRFDSVAGARLVTGNASGTIGVSVAADGPPRTRLHLAIRTLPPAAWWLCRRSNVIPTYTRSHESSSHKFCVGPRRTPASGHRPDT